MKKPEQERVRGLKTLLQDHGSEDLALLRDPKFYVVPASVRADMLKN